MPPKKTKQQNIEAEEKLTAVLIADSFDQQLMPLTESTPRCLLPLCNVPLIEYTFELLATAGVEEILIFCCIHPQQIKDYVAGSKWSKSHSPFEVRVIVTQEAMSVGDVLRELDGKSLIRTDFILIYGDVVSNMNLAGALEQHKARKAVDKNTIMTMMVKEADPGHRARAQPDAVFVVDDANQQCVHYVGPKRGLASQSTVPLSVELFEKHPRLQIRYDLMDCQIDICSVEVPALFTENFDYQDLRRDFVTGILGSEVLDSTFYLHSIGREYAARVQNGQLYDAVSRDVIARWTFPMVPESNLQEGNEYIHKRNHVYQEPGIKLGRTCTLERNLVVGRGTRIGEHAHLADSTLGRGCVVGDHAHVTGAYLLDHVTVADHCRVERSILGRNVNVLSGCTVGTGCLLGDGVIVGPDAHLPPFTRLTRALDGETPDRALVGAEGNAVRWEPSDDEDEDETYAIQAGALGKFTAVVPALP
ncbi:translation initiation factor eIF-2B epsilon subunit, GEF [Tieghemiomyces parasiticus]|uniref:Translation initiation factor eIF-2B epsilon subunit, GEF n=1 Tax=Tieghemiomyces parasiticus TaxID=78921 RepID=A0A9W8A8K7_9FUNG|nr:translation initiation factor eIF-2B epsilon subunit, GEF [Tieghemiomyces parasiticus]